MDKYLWPIDKHDKTLTTRWAYEIHCATQAVKWTLSSISYTLFWLSAALKAGNALTLPVNASRASDASAHAFLPA